MSLTQRLDVWRERRELEREISLIPREELEGYGLSPEEFRAVALMPSEQIARMEEMARINGLDPARLESDRDIQISVALACAHCGEQRRCREALDGGAFRAETSFCPNAQTYRALAAE